MHEHNWYPNYPNCKSYHCVCTGCNAIMAICGFCNKATENAISEGFEPDYIDKNDKMVYKPTCPDCAKKKLYFSEGGDRYLI